MGDILKSFVKKARNDLRAKEAEAAARAMAEHCDERIAEIMAEMQASTARLTARADAAEARVRRLEEALDMKPGWSLSWGPLDEDDEASEYAWMVDAVRGGVNDREWRMIGSGPTPLDALIAAHATEAARLAEAGYWIVKGG